MPPELITASIVDPRWITAAGAAIGGAIALRIVIHWCRMRCVFRGSGGTIIALLAESACAVTRPSGTGTVGPIYYKTENAYFEVGADKYLLCARALERLRNEGYILLVEKRYQLSHLGRQVLEHYRQQPIVGEERGAGAPPRPPTLRCRSLPLLPVRQTLAFGRAIQNPTALLPREQAPAQARVRSIAVSPLRRAAHPRRNAHENALYCDGGLDRVVDASRRPGTEDKGL